MIPKSAPKTAKAKAPLVIPKFTLTLGEKTFDLSHEQVEYLPDLSKKTAKAAALLIHEAFMTRDLPIPQEVIELAGVASFDLPGELKDLIKDLCDSAKTHGAMEDAGSGREAVKAERDYNDSLIALCKWLSGHAKFQINDLDTPVSSPLMSLSGDDEELDEEEDDEGTAYPAWLFRLVTGACRPYKDGYTFTWQGSTGQISITHMRRPRKGKVVKWKVESCGGNVAKRLVCQLDGDDDYGVKPMIVTPKTTASDVRSYLTKHTTFE